MRLRRRRPVHRIPNWDYAGAGWYFVTFVTWERLPLLAAVEHRRRRMRRTAAGNAVLEAWQAIPSHFPGVSIDAFVVMPDHVHGILCFDDLRRTPDHLVPKPVGASGPGRRSLGAVVGSWKSASSRAIRLAWPDAPPRIWQRDSHHMLIRSDEVLDIVRRYIARNPAKWIAKRDEWERVRSERRARG